MARVDTREKLVDAALCLFHARGYNGAGVQDIVVQAGVPKGSFYNHFASKEALGLETIARYARDSDLALLRDTSVAPLARLRLYFETMATRFTESGFSRGCLLGNFGAEMADANPAIREKLSETLKSWNAAIADVLREARDEGSLPAEKNVEQCARFLTDAWEGCLIRGKVMKDSSAVDDFFAIVFGCLLK
jgi:TetR/AcrR family transcriptional repressor of nem operon